MARGTSGEYRVLLIGKTGNGKSASGNTILGRKVFKESVGIVSATEHAQLGEDETRKLKVIDTPDVWALMDHESAQKEVDQWKAMAAPSPDAILLVIRADTRFTPEENAIFLKTKEMLKVKRFDNLIVVFTMADKIGTDEEKFSKELEITNSELKHVLQEARGRYVLLDNTATGSSARPRQVAKLLDLIYSLPRKHVQTAPRGTGDQVLRVMLVGITGNGKSATGNSILGAQTFDSRIGLDTVTTLCRTAKGQVNGCQLEVVDTPGIRQADYDSQTLFSAEIKKWSDSVSPDPHVLLIVLKGHGRFTDADYAVYETMKHFFGRNVSKHIIVVFTGGDHISHCRTTIEKLAASAPQSFHGLINEVENRYVVFDNVTPDKEIQRSQREALVATVRKLVKSNKGRVLHLARKPSRSGAKAVHVRPPSGGTSAVAVTSNTSMQSNKSSCTIS